MINPENPLYDASGDYEGEEVFNLVSFDLPGHRGHRESFAVSRNKSRQEHRRKSA